MPIIRAGFSLIELLFVIAVLGVLSTSGILFYQQRMQNQKIEKTVEQIEQWQQAGVAYYVRNKRLWPIGPPDPAAVLIADGYMPPNSANSNPWCGTGTCYTVQGEGQFFRVTATIQATDAIRQAIAARLGSATVTGETVISTVNVPLSQTKAALSPDRILMQILPYQLSGKDFREGEIGEIWGYKTVGNVHVGTVPTCSRLYGQDYLPTPEVRETITGYDADQKGQNQQLVFSHFAVYPIAVIEGEQAHISISAELRPQHYHKRTFGGWQEPSAVLSEDVRKAIQIRGFIIVVCKRK